MLVYKTQLVEANPQIDCPLRVDAPAALNAPARTRSLNRDQCIQMSSFTPGAVRRVDGDSRDDVAAAAKKMDVSNGLGHSATTRTAVSY